MADVIGTKVDTKGNAIKYKGFPFISNIDMYVQDELAQRSLDRVRAIVPFIKITPGFSPDGSHSSKVVLKGIEAPNDRDPSTYKFNELYRPGSFYRPLAGVKGVTVDYKNQLGSIRKATISWICHTLEDLERLSPYFLNPGYSIFIEWGWSNHAVEAINNDPPVDLSNYFDYARLYQKITNGNYDAMLGIVTNYSFTMNNDGGFECTTEVMSSGYLMEGMSIANQFTQDASKIKELLSGGSTKKEADDIVKKEKADVDAKILTTLQRFLAEEYYPKIKNDLKSGNFEDSNASHDYFLLTDNPDKIDEYLVDDTEGRKVQSSDRFDYKTGKTTTIEITIKESVYASWGYIEDYILNPHILLQAENDDQSILFGFDSRDSKLSAHKYLRTTNLGVCILPLWNPKDTNVPDVPDFRRGEDNENVYNFGYARRVLVNVEFFREMMTSAKTILDGVLQVWSAINDACINFWDLKIITSEQYYDDSNKEENRDPNAEVLQEQYGDLKTQKRPINRYTIVDVNYAETIVNDQFKKEKNFYVFRTKGFDITNPDTKFSTKATSVIKNLSFSSRLASAAALNVFYSAQNTDGRILGSPQTNTFVSLYDFSINGIDYSKARDTFSIPGLKVRAPESGIGNTEISTADQNSYIPDPGTITEIELRDQVAYGDSLTHFLPWGGTKEQSKGYYVKIGDKYLTGIEGMKMAVLLEDGNNPPVTSTALVPLTCDIEVQGISGLRIGNVFTIDHLPKIYQKHGLFQIIGITETLDKNSWITKIRSQFRVIGQDVDYARAKGEVTFTEQQFPPAKYIDVREFNNTFVSGEDQEEILRKIKEIWRDVTVEGFIASDQIINDAYQIVYYESRYSKTAINLKVPDYSLGLFQINMITSPPGKYKLREERTGPDFVLLGIKPLQTKTTRDGEVIDEFNLWDMVTNIQVAKKIFKDANYSWYPWATRVHLYSGRQKNSLENEVSFIPSIFNV